VSASSKKPVPASTTAIRASPPSTKGTTGIQANDLIGRKLAREKNAGRGDEVR
jgi:hypothetical protein